MKEPKKKTIFDFARQIYSEQDVNYFSTLTPEEQELWSTWMIQNILSMNPNLIEVINELQKVSFKLSPELYYKLLIGIIPKSKSFHKYIRSSTEKLYEPWILDILTKEFNLGKNQTKEYISILLKTEEGKHYLISTVSKYGHSKEEITKSIFI
jgi:hypothetical protein